LLKGAHLLSVVWRFEIFFFFSNRSKNPKQKSKGV